MPSWDYLEYQEPERRHEWWTAPEDVNDEQEATHRARSLYDQVRSLEDSQRTAHEQNLWNARLYSNRELINFDWGHGIYYNPTLAPISVIGENVILSVVHTLISRVGKHRTKVTPMPHGASFKIRRACRKLDKWLYGEFTRLSVFAKTKRVFRDACVFGFGALKITMGQNGKLAIRRVFPDDLVVDQAEAVNADDGYLQHIYERRCRRVEEVEAEYGLEPGTIQVPVPRGYLPYRSPGRGWCVVVEGYRTGLNGEPGRHVVSTESTLLLDEEWSHDWTPYIWYHYNDPLTGFYWPGVVEQCLPFQIRLNEINEVIRDAQDLMARPRILVAEGSRVNPADIDNVVGRILKYTGIKPEALNWDAVSPELYNERERLIRACFEQFGLTQMVAQGKLPDGARLDSSVAINEAAAVSDDRQADATQRFEEFHLLLAKRMIQVISACGSNYETTWYSGGRNGRAETIKWSEIDLEENAYVLTLEPASVFSMTPAARTDKLEDWLAQGKITLDQYWEYSGQPDIEGIQTIQRGASDDLARVQELLEDGKYESPTPAQDLVNGVKRLSLAYLSLCNYDDVTDEVKTNFIKWVSMARAILEQGTESPPFDQTTQPPPQAGVPPGPGAAPMMMAPPMMGPPGLPQA
jgi:hypothetical protein